MALLQISEPGQSTDPHQRRIAVGIDLGTTHSLVAAVRNGVAECLPDDEGRLILSVVIVGTAVDSVLRGVGVFEFQDQSPLIPLWLMLLWALLATTLRHCLQWSGRPWWLASGLGAAGGALSYYGGGRLAGVQFPYGELPTLIGIGLLWALLFPLLHTMARRLAG